MDGADCGPEYTGIMVWKSIGSGVADGGLDSRLRGNDMGVWGCSGRYGGLVHLARSGFFLYALARVMQRSPFVWE